MISCILLAAGVSLRFGSPKPLARIDSKTIIEFIQERLLSTGLSEIIVVLGNQAEAIAPFVLKNPRIKYVVNANYKLGQTSSFKTGLEAVSPESKGIMLLPADTPLIKPSTIDELIRIFLEKSPAILVPAYADRKGHPPVFSARLKEELLGLKNDEPVSSILRKRQAEILKVPVDDEGVTLSFNTPEELEQIIRKINTTK